jgi:Nuclease-related domain
MAKLIPAHDPAEIENAPERTVAEALCKQLPSDVRIFHSYPWMRKERDLDKPWQGEVIREGEADFVIVDPRYGIMVIEVKGGQMFYESATRRWDRRGATHAVKDPFEQASRNLFTLEKLVKDRSFPGGELPFVRTRAVVFPDCDFYGTLPPGVVRENLVVASDLAKIGAKIEALFQSYAFRASPSGIGKAALDGILIALTSTFRLVPALWREIEDQERQIFRLTEQQAQLLDFLGSRKRAAVEGVAGSGKTKLAMIRARRFADEGKEVLFVCYNKLLADWLRDELPEEYRERITVLHYHGLCAEWVKEAKLAWPNVGNDPGFWKGTAPRLFEQALDRLPKRFDAVVVDEAQDFESSWWDGLELVNAGMTDGPLYVFYDPAQRIFSREEQMMPALGEPFSLGTNCRNTKAISSQCGKVIGKEIKVMAGTPMGKEPQWIEARTPEEQRKSLEKQVKEWIASGLKPNQIVVVAAKTLESSCCATMNLIGGVPVTEKLDDWQNGKALLQTTLGKFKGLEVDAMVLVDVPAIDGNFRKEHLYVACSRARHLLTILIS